MDGRFLIFAFKDERTGTHPAMDGRFLTFAFKDERIGTSECANDGDVTCTLTEEHSRRSLPSNQTTPPGR